MSGAAVILAYANPLGGQPAASTFVVERLDHGVALHKPLGPDWLRGAVFGFVGLVTCVVTAGMAGSTFVERPRNRDPLSVLIPILLVLAGIAALLLWHAWRVCRQRTLSVVLRAGRLTVTHSVWTVTGRPWAIARVRRFSVATSGVEVIRLRLLGNVMATNRFRLGRAFLHNLPRDECVWIAGLLNAALPGEPPT